MVPYVLISLLLAGPSETPAPQTGAADSLPTLAGMVRADGYGDGRLIGAVVEVHQEGSVRRAVADVEGRYRLAELSPGATTVRVHHIAAMPFQVEVRLPSTGEVTLHLDLESRVFALPGVSALGTPALTRPAEPLDVSDRDRTSIGLQALDSSPGMAESGLSTGLPGEPVPDGDRVLYMRGSAVDARVVLLDGAPVMTPFHVAGLVEAFDPELLGGADLYIGGAPSSYSGGISYLLDVRTRAPRHDRLRGAVSLDGIGARAMAEAPLPGQGSLLIGARGLHGLLPTLGDRDQFPYRFDDVLVRVGVPLRGHHALRWTAFTNREGVRLVFPEPDPTSGDAALWGNQVSSLGYEGIAGSVHLTGTAAVSRYTSSLPVLFWPEPVITSATADRMRFEGAGEVPVRAGRIHVGGSVERMEYDYRLDPVDPGTSGTPVQEASLTSTAGGVFGEWSGDVRPDLSLRAGLRVDRHGHDGTWRLAPRLAARHRFGSATLTASVGRFHQALPAPGLRGEGGEDGSALRWDPHLPVASATHLVVGLEQEIDDDIHIDILGFFKTFTGLGRRGDEESRSSGAELRVGRAGERARGWLGYQISWFWTLEGNDGSARFDGRHLLSVGAEATLPGGIEIGGTLGYGAGLPMSAVQLHVEREFSDESNFAVLNSMRVGDSRELGIQEFQMNAGGGESPLELAPADDFLRLDLEVGWPLEPSLGGRTTILRPYVKVINALDRRDSLFYYFDGWREDGVRPLAQRPFLPLVGLEWRF